MNFEPPFLTTLSWLRGITSKYSKMQQIIYSAWLKRVNLYISEFNLPKKDADTLLQKKAFSYFFPHHSMMRPAFELPDIHSAISILKTCYYSKEQRIIFYGDRDADGISSLAILYLFLRDQLKYPEKNLIPLVPREHDKYGITEEVADRILNHKPDVLIILDCGSSNHKEITYLHKQYQSLNNGNLKLKTIIIDHHFIPESKQDYPHVDAFINPKRLLQGNPNRELCTAGLAYKLIWGLTYSFTSEYEKLYQVTVLKEDSPSESKFIYFKNLIQSYSEKIKIKINHDFSGEDSETQKDSSSIQGECHNIELAPLWNKMVSSNSFFSRIQNFLHFTKFTLSVEDQSLFLFQANFRNIREKTQNYLIFSAIGSIADMVPLIDDNRIIVKEGLSLLNQYLKVEYPLHPSLEGIIALVRFFFSQQNQIWEENLSFVICPAINAAGRLGKAEVALNSLIEKDRLIAVKKASELKKLNEERKKISKDITKKIIFSSDITTHQKEILIVYDERIHRGISGLIANRLSDHFGKPALVLVNDDDSIRGSIRSAQNQNVFSFLMTLEHWFIQFGGHKQAAGCSLEKNKLKNFIKAAQELGEKFFPKEQKTDSKKEKTHDEYFEPISINDYEITTTIWEECNLFAPFGKKNPAPVLAIRLTQPVMCENIGKSEEHVKIKFFACKNELIEGVWFFHKGEADKLSKHAIEEKPQILFAEPSMDSWRGRKVYRLKVTKISPDQTSSISV